MIGVYAFNGRTKKQIGFICSLRNFEDTQNFDVNLINYA